jgi:hypothetical protein
MPGARRVSARRGWASEKKTFSALCQLGQHQAPSRQLTKDWLNAEADGRRNEVTGAEGASAEAILG